MSHLITENRDGALWVTFNRPEVYNAMSPQMTCQIVDMWEMARSDDSIRMVVLTGAGDKAFSAGADLKLLIPLVTGVRKPENEYDHRALEPGHISRLTLRSNDFFKPLISAVNGAALAGGCELAILSDIRIASSTARFGLSEPKRGIIAGGGSLVRLPRQLSWCQAMEFQMTAEPITAQRALEIGLINKVVEPDQLIPETEKLVAQLLKNAPLALQAIKRVALESSGVPIMDGYAIEDRESARIVTTEDAREGPLAFAEKREPKFRGR